MFSSRNEDGFLNYLEIMTSVKKKRPSDGFYLRSRAILRLHRHFLLLSLLKTLAARNIFHAHFTIPPSRDMLLSAAE